MRVKTSDGEIAEVVSREPAEDLECGLLTSIDSITVEYPDGFRESFWHTDLEYLDKGE